MIKKVMTLPRQFDFLLYRKARYKVAHGGRASAKSTSFIRALIAISSDIQRPEQTILCTREIQNSINESVHRTIVNQIKLHGLQSKFDIYKNEIINVETRSRFIFYGLKTNVDKIKSIPKINYAYVEEADKISDESWDVLIPTVREPDSEIWIVFNDNFEDDPVYQRFVINKPDNAIVVKVNYLDIPRHYLSQAILDEAEYCRQNDPAAYNHIWLGNPVGAGGKRVWAPFDENVHVKELSREELHGATAFMAMDPHSKYFPFCVWVARKPVDNTGKVFSYYVYNEWPRYEMFRMMYHELRNVKLFAEWGGIRDLAQQIFSNDGESLGLKPVARFIDTRYAKGAGGEAWSTGTAGIVAEMGAVNVHFRMPAERIIDVQRERILDAMRYNKMLPISETNCPLFYVAPWCRNVINSLRLHRTQDGCEREEDKYKDASDALRICFAGMQTYQQEAPRVIGTMPKIDYTEISILNTTVPSEGWMS